MVSSVTPPEASSVARSFVEQHRLAELREAHVVEQDAVGSRGERLANLCERVALDLHGQRGRRLAAAVRLPGRFPPARRRWLSLTRIPSKRPRRWFVPAAAAHGVLLERPQAGRRLAGVEQHGVGALDRVGVATGQGCNAREPAEQVESRALGGEDGASLALHPGEDGGRVEHAVAVVGERLEFQAGVEGAEDRLRDMKPADDAGLLEQELCDAGLARPDERDGGHVAGAEILGERCVDDAGELELEPGGAGARHAEDRTGRRGAHGVV